MNAEPSHVLKPALPANAAPQQQANRLRFYLSLSLVSAALFGGCGAAQQSFEGETVESVATDSEGLRADELDHLPQDEISMQTVGPRTADDPRNLPSGTEALAKALHNENRSLCRSDCVTRFSAQAQAQTACEDFCDCLYEGDLFGPTLSEMLACVDDFIQQTKQ